MSDKIHIEVEDLGEGMRIYSYADINMQYEIIIAPEDNPDRLIESCRVNQKKFLEQVGKMEANKRELARGE